MIGGSNYLPTLEKVHELLDLGYHSNLALSIYFFSDGMSTDHKKLGVSIEESYKLMEDSITTMASKFGETLTVSMVGLGDVYDRFEPLKVMANAATASGAKGSFVRCEKTALSISSSISSMVTSTMQSRVALQDGGRARYTERSNLSSEMNSFPKYKWNYFKIIDHLQYCPRQKELFHVPSLPLAAVLSDPEKAFERQRSPPPFMLLTPTSLGWELSVQRFVVVSLMLNILQALFFKTRLLKKRSIMNASKNGLCFINVSLQHKTLQAFLLSNLISVYVAFLATVPPTLLGCAF